MSESNMEIKKNEHVLTIDSYPWREIERVKGCKEGGEMMYEIVSTAFEWKLARAFERLVRWALSVALFGTVVAILMTGIKTFVDTRGLWHQSALSGSKAVVFDLLVILALIELFRTGLVYFTEGRVRVTYIIDTVLVIMLTETLTLWFTGKGIGYVLIALTIIATLSLLRILTIKFSPRNSV